MRRAVRISALIALALIMLTLVSGCADKDPVCVMTNPPPPPGHGYPVLDDRACQLGNPDVEWRTPS